MMRNDGFTLIELIAALTLAGILAAVAVVGIVTAVRGYIFSSTNVAVAQDSQLVIARLSREISELSAIDRAGSNNTCLRYKVDTESPFYRAIGWHDRRLEINIAANADGGCPTSAAPGDLLAGQVGSFTIGYVDKSGAVGGTPPADLNDLYEVRIDFRLDRMDGEPGTAFAFRVNPRNNGDLNGPS
jgi:prepilin-type N-terminal cleavage/methylation domain-containing protein